MYVAHYEDDTFSAKLFIYKDNTVKFIIDYGKHQVSYDGTFSAKHKTFSMQNNPASSLFYITRQAWGECVTKALLEYKAPAPTKLSKVSLTHQGNWDL